MNKDKNFPLNCLDGAKKNLNLLLNESRDRINNLLSLKEKNYFNFIRKIMDERNLISSFFTPIQHLHSVNNSEESQKAFSECIGDLINYSTELVHNKNLYQAYKDIKQAYSITLNEAQNKVLDDAILNFELEGVNLSTEKKKRVNEINVELGELTNSFSQNVLNAVSSYQLNIHDESLLGNMPLTDKNTAYDGNKWVFTLKLTSYIPFMTYCIDRAKREELYKAYSTMAPENSDILEKILSLRQEKAKILGFSSYAEMKNQAMSAPSALSVIEFLRKLSYHSKPFAERELIELTEYASEKGVFDLQAYDFAFFSDSLKKNKIGFDEELVRPYFELSGVLQGLFNFLGSAFNLKFKKLDLLLWHPKASYYNVYHGDTFIGGLFTDFEARFGKRSGAWMNDWHTYHRDSKNDLQYSDVFLVCNFPESTDSSPSLLRHSDVATLFHEMGHALHHLLSRVEEYSVSGTSGVAWDTIEFPSQFLENFAYNAEVLNSMGKHYVTGELLPKSFVEQIVSLRNFQSAYALSRQIEFSLFDILIHLESCTQSDVQRILDNVRLEVSVLIPPAYNKFQNSFLHIFGGDGYAAGYYSYKWAEKYSSDAYCEILKNKDKVNEICFRYKETVLSFGGSIDMNDIYLQFLNREPSVDSILILDGIYGSGNSTEQ